MRLQRHSIPTKFLGAKPFTGTVAVIVIYALLASESTALAQIRLPGPANVPTPQNLFQETLGYFIKQKIGNTLPIKLDATEALPTVPNAQLPGGPFHGTPLPLTAEAISQPLAPGDYEIRVMAYCTQFSVHRPGRNAATVLAPLDGTQAKTIGNLLWRGTQAGKSPQELQNVAWAIQNGLSFEQMPKAYQNDIMTLVPEGRAALEQGFSVDRPVRELYNDIFANPRKYMLEYKHEKGWKWPDMLVPNIRIAAPPFDQFIASLGPIGRAYVSAEQDRQAFIRNIVAQQHGQERPFVATTDPPLPPTQGPWTVRVPGRAYMRVIVQGGNMRGDNILQIRVLPQPIQGRVLGDGQTRLIYAFQPQRRTASPGAAPSPIEITVLGLLGAGTMSAAQLAAAEGAFAAGQAVPGLNVALDTAALIAFSVIAAQALIIVLSATTPKNNKGQTPPPPVTGPMTATGAPPQPGGGPEDKKKPKNKLTSAEQAMKEELEAEGHQVEVIDRGPGKTADFLIDGKETELKTLTELNENTMKNAIQNAAQQGEYILIDARNTSATPEYTMTQITRAEGAVGNLQGRVTVLTNVGPVEF